MCNLSCSTQLPHTGFEAGGNSIKMAGPHDVVSNLKISAEEILLAFRKHVEENDLNQLFLVDDSITQWATFIRVKLSFKRQAIFGSERLWSMNFKIHNYGQLDTFNSIVKCVQEQYFNGSSTVSLESGFETQTDTD